MGIIEVKKLLKKVDNEIVISLDGLDKTIPSSTDTAKALFDIRDLIVKALRLCYEKLE